MKKLRPAAIFLCLLLAGGYAFSLETVTWEHTGYASEFKYFQESEAFTRETWAALPPEEQSAQLRHAYNPALDRQEQIREYYAAAMTRWDAGAARDYADNTGDTDIKTVRLWLGEAKAAALAKKLSVTRRMLQKASSEGLEGADLRALSPYLTRRAISDLSGVKAASGLQRQAEVSSGKYGIPRKAANATVEKVSGELGQQTGRTAAKFFDGSASSGDAPEPVSSREGSYTKNYEVPKAAINSVTGNAAGATGRQTSKNVSGLLNQPSAPAATTIKSKTPAPLPGTGLPPTENKSAAWTSDAYGYTIEAGGRTLKFRDQKEAEAAIRSLPNGSVSKVTLYGHGAPGMQSVGSASYEAGDTAALLQGKMARGGVIQYSGCNTASIGGPTLNPAVGLSMVARRVLYFSIPYFQDRLNGVPADEAKQQWDKGWNADLSRDTSLKIKGAIVCGYRTFGLVPGRLPGLTRLMGSQEAATPGYVAGKKACYQDGREVPEP